MAPKLPSETEIAEVVVEVLRDWGTVQTQAELHRLALPLLRERDADYRLTPGRMRRVALRSGLVSVAIRTRSVGAVPEVDEADLRRMGLRYDPVVQRWRRVRDGDDLSGAQHHRGEFASPGQPCPVCREPLAKVHNATLFGGRVPVGFRCELCGYLTGHRWREPARYAFSLKQEG